MEVEGGRGGVHGCSDGESARTGGAERWGGVGAVEAVGVRRWRVGVQRRDGGVTVA